jgi:hypothetical protein
MIDFGKFHNVFDVDTPEYSAKELDKNTLAEISTKNT